MSYNNFSFNGQFGNPMSPMGFPGSKVLTPNEVFDYSGYVMSSYPQQYKMEPMVGFKIMMLDEQNYPNQAEKINFIEQNSQAIFYGKNCLLREGPLTNKFSYFLISLPVPRSHLPQQMTNISYVLQMLKNYVYLRRSPLTEINVSGKCNVYETETMLSSFNIPQKYMRKIMMNNPFKFGDVVRISQEYMCLRTKWSLPDEDILDDDMPLIAQLISAIFH